MPVLVALCAATMHPPNACGELGAGGVNSRAAMNAIRRAGGPYEPIAVVRIESAIWQPHPQPRLALLTAETHDVRRCVLPENAKQDLQSVWKFCFGAPQTSRAEQGRTAEILVASERRGLLASVEALACGDAGIATEFMRILVATNCEAVAALYHAQRAAVWSELARLAHQLDGSLRMLGCSRVDALSAALQRSARDDDRTRVRVLLPMIATVVESVNAVFGQALAGVGIDEAGNGCDH
jgi:HPt (histidine-containing phosphotransfer) domain-containing protein